MALKSVKMGRLATELKKLGDLYRQEVIRGIIAKDMVASGKLKHSIRVELEENGFKITSDRINSYLLGEDGYRPKGRGTKRDKEDKWIRLGEWARSKGMQPLMRDKRGRFKKVTQHSYKQLGYLISRSIDKKGTIKRFGYKGSEVIQDTVEKMRAKSIDVITEAFREDIIAMVKEDFKFNNIEVR